MIEVMPLRSNPNVIDEIIAHLCDFRFLSIPAEPHVLLEITTPRESAAYLFSKLNPKGPKPVLSINERPDSIRTCPDLHLVPAENSTQGNTLQSFTRHQAYLHVEMMDFDSYWAGATLNDFNASLNIQIPKTRAPFDYRNVPSPKRSQFGLRKLDPTDFARFHVPGPLR